MVVFGGYLLASGRISLAELCIAVYSGNLLSAALMYYFGEHILEFFRQFARFGWAKELLNPQNLRQTEAWFRRWGLLAVIFSRFSAGIRFFVAIVAGMTHMPLWLFLLAFTIATTIWNSILVYGGWLLGEKWEKMLEILQVYNIFVMGLLVSAAALWAYWRWRTRSRRRQVDKM